MKTLITLILFLSSTIALSDTEKLESECSAGKGLSCAKLGYLWKTKGAPSKAYEYYEKGCELADETSCYNKETVNPKTAYQSKVDVLINFHKENIQNCHQPIIKNKYSTTQLKEVWHNVNIKLQINRDGSTQSINIKTDLEKSFIKCAQDQIKNIDFPTHNYDSLIYDYELSLICYH
jgi:hypothetical protein